MVLYREMHLPWRFRAATSWPEFFSSLKVNDRTAVDTTRLLLPSTASAAIHCVLD
jgi:hypothetical protein